MTIKDKLRLKERNKLRTESIKIQSELIELEIQVDFLKDKLKNLEENFDKILEERTEKAYQRELKKQKRREMLKKYEEQCEQKTLCKIKPQKQENILPQKTKKINKTRQRVQ